VSGAGPIAKNQMKKKLLSQVPVAHSYNPSYSGGRDQEDFTTMLAGEIVQETLSLKILLKNRAEKRNF
jgi:hypothetical protein